tara:strand:- start:122 stop:337 length:216 start_codon:yes stop_codon:yes gene_type:complete
MALKKSAHSPRIATESVANRAFIADQSAGPVESHVHEDDIPMCRSEHLERFQTVSGSTQCEVSPQVPRHGL